MTLMISCVASTLGFGVARADWDTYSGFVAALEHTRSPIQAGPAVAFAEVPDGAGLALLAPGAVDDVPGLRRFVVEGGRLLLAVESPEATTLLAAFGLHLANPPSDGERLGGHAALWVLRAPDRGLFGGVGALVTNRPVALRGTDLEPVLGWPGGDGLVHTLRLGAGEVIAVGDASLFIDLMRPVAGNAAFADRIARWLAEDGRPVYVATGAGALRGVRQRDPPAPPWSDRLNQALEALRTEGPLSGGLARGLSVVLSLLLALWALLRFPGGRRAGPPPAPPADRAAALAGRPGGPGAATDAPGAAGGRTAPTQARPWTPEAMDP
jgi:hypothetical protein